MRLITFTRENAEKCSLGAVLGDDKAIDLHLASEGFLPSNMLSFIQGGEKFLHRAKDILNKPQTQFVYRLDSVNLKAPILNPPSLRDFFAFEDHAKAGARRRNEELAKDWYELPVYYKGNHREIYGPEDEIPWPFYTRKLDFECEIACVIGNKGKNIQISEAQKYIFGYMIFNDFSARDIQKKEMMLRLGPAKSKDFANSFGPYLVTQDEINPEKDFSLTVKVNNETWSTGYFKDQYWGFPVMVSHVSQEETIYPGDILGSGTFYKGCGLDLDKWIKAGDTIELEVNKLGILKNKIGIPKMQKELNYKKMRLE